MLVDPNKYTKTKLLFFVLLIIISWLSSRLLGPGNLIGTMIFVFFIIVLTYYAVYFIQQKREQNKNRSS